jgi:predicted small metal-binding protein
MLRVACKDMGIGDCDFVAEGEKSRKVEYKMLEHMRDRHPELIAGLTDVQHKDLEARITSGIHAVEPDVQAAS